MPNNPKIIFEGDASSLVNAAKQGEQAVNSLAQDANAASTKLADAGKKASEGLGQFAHSEAFGLSRREFSHLSGAATEAFRVVGEVAGKADEGIGKIATSLTGLASSFLFAGALGAAIAAVSLAVSVFQQRMAELRDELTKSISTNDDYLRNLQGMVTAYPAIAAAAHNYAAALADVSIAEQQAAAARSQNIIVSAIFEQRLKDAQAAAAAEKSALEAMTFGVQSGYDEVEHLRGSMEGLIVTTDAAASSAQNHAQALLYEAAAADRAAAAMGDTRGEAINLMRQDARSYSQFQTESQWGNKIFVAGLGWVDKDYQQQINKFNQAQQQIAQKLQGLVTNALQVPDFSAHLAKVQAGIKDAFENMFRFQAVATGTDPSKYGQAFMGLASYLQSIGVSADQAAKGMQDFSIFAQHPELINKGLIDMGAVIDDVRGQLQAMAGKALVIKSAMQQVWASLSAPEKAALADAGINNVSDAMAALEDPTQKTKKQVDGLNAAISAIPNSITTTFNVIKDTAEQAIKDFQQVLDDFISKYSSVTISINAEANTTTNQDNGGTPPPPPPPTENPNPGKYAHGLDFVVPPGFPSDTYSFRGNFTSGERVTVTPRGNGNRGGGNSFVFYATVSNQAMLDALMRKVRALAMLNAT